MQRDSVTHGVVVITCGLWLVGSSPVAAQTAVAGPPAPPQEERSQADPSAQVTPLVTQSPETLARSLVVFGALTMAVVWAAADWTSSGEAALAFGVGAALLTAGMLAAHGVTAGRR